MTPQLSSLQSSRERGSALVEFVLSISLFWVPLFLGTLVVGFGLVRAVQVTQLCRDAGHMYSFGMDFSQPAYQTLLANMAQGYTLTSTGNAVIVLSTIEFIGPNECSGCTNENTPVFTRQIVVGNSSIHASSFGTPPSADMNSDGSGDVLQSAYLNDSRDQATGFSNVIPMTDGQYAYVAEMWVQSPDVRWWSFLGQTSLSARSIF